MSNWAGGVLTAAGRVLQAKVEAGTTALILTKIKLGDGTEGMDAVDNLTDLVGPKAVLGISSSVADGDHATITGVMLSTQLQAGFWCREWGLFARDPDDGEILYMITIDNQPEWLPASTAAAQVSATYAMNIAVANATNIEVNIDPAGLVDVEMLQSYIGLCKRSFAYSAGETAMLEGIPAGYFLECTTGGTTGSTAPVITPPVAEGDTINDGTVVWTIRRCLPNNGGIFANGSVNYHSSDTTGRINFGFGSDGGNINIFGKNNPDLQGGTAFSAVNGTQGAQFNLWYDGRMQYYPDLVNAPTKVYNFEGSAIVAKSINNVAANYIKFASGLVLQWGNASDHSSSVTSVTVTLPIRLTITGRVFITPQSGTPRATSIETSIMSEGNFVIHADATYGMPSFDWFVIGY